MKNKQYIFNYIENDKFHTIINLKIISKELKNLSLEFILISNKNKILRKKFKFQKATQLVQIRLKEFRDEILKIGEFGILIIFTKGNLRDCFFNTNIEKFLINTSYSSVGNASIKEISKNYQGIFSIEKPISKDIFILLNNTSFQYYSLDLCILDKSRITFNYAQRIEINPWNSKLIKLDKRKLENIKEASLNLKIKGLHKCIMKKILIIYI